jgi:hypothetical protein
MYSTINIHSIPTAEQISHFIEAERFLQMGIHSDYLSKYIALGHTYKKDYLKEPTTSMHRMVPILSITT